MMNFRVILILLISLLFLLIGGQPARAKPVSGDLRWAYMMNIIHYITWPQAKVDPVISVCIIGNNPFLVVEDDVVLNKRTGGITIARHYEQAPDIEILSQCNIVYFSQTVTLAQLSFMISKLEGLPVLTVGDHLAFVRLGGLLQFIKKGKKLRFKLNKERLNKMALKVHPSLLRLSD